MVLLVAGITCGVIGGIGAIWVFCDSLMRDARHMGNWAKFERAVHREYVNRLVLKAIDNDDPRFGEEIRQAILYYREFV